MMGPITLVVADDHRLVRESLVTVLTASGECRVLGQAGNGPEAVREVVAHQPRVAIIDISMPGLNGIEVVRRLRQEAPATRCLVLTMHEEEEYLLQMVRAGAAGYMVKDRPAIELLEAVRQVANGRAHFGPEAARILAEQVHRPEHAGEDPYGTLTNREREVFHLVVEGCTTKEIARRLEISVKTAENHRGKVMAKLGARNSAEIVRYAARKGLIDRTAD
ncbi:response regulator [Pseudomarimonas salicorniae]|uniref:Response regulator transcription factor n=1 Tax=Pseudomarimonas salicorniae TaxID=2933270 RepID=A0ABT0GIP0_9GAMM|nr:response regulator transcription factor [Lysobacter sp. CAU 1642]MCK7594406.1 response regulator transcription factor [Lysobacter sp. CAU 1642]